MVNCVLAILGENNEKAMKFGLGVNLTNILWAQDRTLIEHFTTPGNSTGFYQPPVFRDNTIVYIYRANLTLNYPGIVTEVQSIFLK